jgi:formylglycine-generating enzyme required for sulfatase activity
MKRAVKAVFLACVVLGVVWGLASAKSQNKSKVAVYVTGGAPTPTSAPVFNIDIEMVFVDGGTFTMGCTSEQGSDCWSYESPTHQVTLSSFSIGKYPVTQAQWVAVMGSNPSHFKGDNLPVEYVSWNDIVNDFIPKLNALTGKTYRLPTESEWEFAARGGNSSKRYRYSGSNSIGDVAWYSSNSGRATRPVGTKQSNELGLFDMSGNVWEWVGDWDGSYTSTSKTNPTGPALGSYREVRGGSWDDDAGNCRVSNRGINAPGDRYYGIGFRLVLSL